MSKSAIINESRTLLLNEKQVVQRIDRLAWQIFEDNANEKEIVLAGIMKSGFNLCEKIADVLKSISPLIVFIAEVHVDKHSQVNKEVIVSLSKDKYKDKVVILIDDVLNSGKTMLFALKPFLEVDVKKIRTVVLIDRNHKRFPIAADFAGLSLSTTLQEHVSVEFGDEGICAWLS